MDDFKDVFDNIVKLIDNLLDNLSRGYERVESGQREIFSKLSQLKGDLHLLQTKAAVGESDLNALRTRVKELEAAATSNDRELKIKLADITNSMNVVLNWIAIENSRKDDAEKQEARLWRQQISNTLLKIAALGGAGAGGGALYQLLSRFFGG